MKILKNISMFVVLFSLALLVSCEYEFIEVSGPEPPDPNDTTIDSVSFALEVEPIFDASSCTNCHNGGISPNLTAGNAFESITSEGLVVPGDPDASKIYFYPHPVTGTHNTKYGSTDDADLIYLWIYQGALDN